MLLLPALLLSGFIARSQEHMRLAGYVEIPAQPLADYYLEISVKNGEVNGYSITGYKSGNRLKAKVIGRMPTASELLIEEVPSNQEGSGVYCYFKAVLKLSVYKTTRRWSGSFESHQSNGLNCGTGLMTIMDNAPPLDPVPSGVKPSSGRMKVQQEATENQQPKPAVKKDTVSSNPKAEAPKVVVQKPKIVAAPASQPAKVTLLPRDTNNCLKTIEWASDNLRLEIWDGVIIDGDVVSVFWNGQIVLDHKKLDENHLSFPLKLKSGSNILEIRMYEEGFEPGNSPYIILSEGSQSVPLHVSGDYNQRARICLERIR